MMGFEMNLKMNSSVASLKIGQPNFKWRRKSRKASLQFAAEVGVLKL